MERDEKPPSAQDDSDLLTGYGAIGSHLGWTGRQVKHRGTVLPIFWIGRTPHARRSTLNAWLAEREAAGRENKADA